MSKLSRADSGVSSQLPLGNLSLHSTNKTRSYRKASTTTVSTQSHSGDKRNSPQQHNNKENNPQINKVLKKTKARKSLGNQFDHVDSNIISSAAVDQPFIHEINIDILFQSIELLYCTNNTVQTKLVATLRQYVPLTQAKHKQIISSMQHIIPMPQYNRIIQQLDVFEHNGTVPLNQLPLYCQYPEQYKLSCIKCKQSSLLSCMCTSCGVDSKYVTTQNEYVFMTKLTKKQLSSTTEIKYAIHPLSDPSTMLHEREQCTLRSISCLKKLAKKSIGFDIYGGDMLFLLRNAIYRGQGSVSIAARDTVEYMINKWDKSECSILDTYCEHEHLMGYTECLHGKIELQWHDQKQFDRMRNKISTALTHCSVNDILRFDPSTAKCIPQTDAGYCIECGTFQPLRQIYCSIHQSHKLTQEREYEAMTESLVWTSVFTECGIVPFRFNDATVQLSDILQFVSQIRPYQSLTQLGRDSYITQSYWITHLIFIMSGWGGVQLDKLLFINELLYMIYNMDVVIKLGDAELVGEYLHSLHILGIDKQHQCMLRGYYYLLTNEITSTKSGVLIKHGNWVKSNTSYHKQYHTAYTGVIGLADMIFDKQEHAEKFFPKQWYHYFQ